MRDVWRWSLCYHSSFSVVVVEPVAVCICHVALHLVFHNCSDLPSDVSMKFSKLAENSSTYRVFNVSSPLIESASKLSLFSHCPHVTASTDVLNLFAFRL